MLLQHHNECRNTSAKEDIGRQTNDSVDVVLLYEVLTNLPLAINIFFWITSKKYAMRQNDSENAVRLDVVEFMEQKRIISLALWSHTVILETRVHFCISRIPMLRIWRIADHSIYIKRLAHIACLYRPIFIKRVCTASIDVVWLDTTHHKIHSSEVIGILFQLLCIVLNFILVLDMPTNRLANSDKQRTRTRCWVVNLDSFLCLMVFCHNLRHKYSYFEWCIELTSLFACIGGEVTNQIFINIAKHVIVLTAIGRNILNEFYEVF